MLDLDEAGTSDEHSNDLVAMFRKNEQPQKDSWVVIRVNVVGSKLKSQSFKIFFGLVGH